MLVAATLVERLFQATVYDMPLRSGREKSGRKDGAPHSPVGVAAHYPALFACIYEGEPGRAG